MPTGVLCFVGKSQGGAIREMFSDFKGVRVREDIYCAIISISLYLVALLLLYLTRVL